MITVVVKALVTFLLAILLLLSSSNGKNQKEATNLQEEDCGGLRQNNRNGVAFCSSSSSSSSSSSLSSSSSSSVVLDSNGDFIPRNDFSSSYYSRSNNNDRVSHENWVHLQKSKIWSSNVAGGLHEEEGGLEEVYYQPNCATMNPNVAYSYFNLFSGFIDDGREQQRCHLSSSPSPSSSSYITRQKLVIDPSEKVYILELGANSGKFGFHFLKALQSQGEYLGIPTERIVYIITDRSSKNMDRIRRERSLLPFLVSGQLILMNWDWSYPIEGIDNYSLATPPPRHLKESFIQQLKASCIHSNHSTQLDELNSFPGTNPLFVISNFFLSTLNWDIFKSNRGGLFHELLLDTSISAAAEYSGGGGGGGGDLAFVEVALGSYYSNTTSLSNSSIRACAGLTNSDLIYLDQVILENHIAHSGSSSSSSNDQSVVFGIPIGAFKLLRGLSNLTNGGNFMLTYIENTTSTSIVNYDRLQYFSAASAPSISLRSLTPRYLSLQEDEIEKFVRHLGGGSLSNTEATSARAYKGQATEDEKMCQSGSIFLFPAADSNASSNDCVFRNMGGAFHDNFVKFSPLETLRLYNQTKQRPHKVEKKSSNFAEGGGGGGTIVDDLNYVFWSLSVFRWDPDLLLSLAPILIRNQQFLVEGGKVKGRGSGDQLEKISEFRNIGYILQKSYSLAYFDATKIDFARILYQLLPNNEGFVAESLLTQSYFAVLFDLFGVGNTTIGSTDSDTLSLSLLLSLSNVTAAMGGDIEGRRRRSELLFMKVKYFDMTGEIDLSLNLLEELIIAPEDGNNKEGDEERSRASIESLVLWNKIVDHRNRYAIRHSRSKSTAFASFVSNDVYDVDDEDSDEIDDYDFDDDDDDDIYSTRDSIAEDVYLNVLHQSESYIGCCLASPTELASCSKSSIKYSPFSHQRVKKIESAQGSPTLFASSPGGNRIAIISYATNSKSDNYFKYSSVINGAYCEPRGCRFIVPPFVDNSILSDIDPDWVKVYLLKKFMESKQNTRSFDYIMWVDPDFIFTDFNRSLEEIILSARHSEETHMFISAHDYDNSDDNSNNNNINNNNNRIRKKQIKKKQLYTGSFIMRTSEWSLNFVKDWWGRSISENARNIKRFKNSRNEEGKLDELYFANLNSNKIAVVSSNDLGSAANLYRENSSFALHLRGEIPHFRSKVLAVAFKSLCSGFRSNYDIDRDEYEGINYFDSDVDIGIFSPIVKRSELLAIASESYGIEVKKRNDFMMRSSARSVSATFLVEMDIVYSKLCEFTQLSSASKHDRSCNSLYLLQLDLLKMYFLRKNFSATTDTIATSAKPRSNFDEIMTKAPEYTVLIVTMVDLFNRLAVLDGVDLHLKLDLSNSLLLIFETLKKYSAFSTSDLSPTTSLIYTSMIRSFRILVKAKSYDRAHSYLNTLIGYVNQYEVILGCTKEVEVTLYRVHVMLLQHAGSKVGDSLKEANELFLLCEQKVLNNRKYANDYLLSNIDISAVSDLSSVFGSHDDNSTMLESSPYRIIPKEEYTNYPNYVSLDTIFLLQSLLKALNATHLKQSQNVESKLCLENYHDATLSLAKVDPSADRAYIDLDLYELTIESISDLNSCRKT